MSCFDEILILVCMNRISDAPAVAQTQNPNKLAHVVSYSTCKRRSPFVPFAIQNLTGCDLKFATITVNSDRHELQDRFIKYFVFFKMLHREIRYDLCLQNSQHGL